MTDPLRKRGYDGYDPNEPRIPKHHTGGGERTRDSVAAADNAGVRPGEPLPIPIFQGWDKPHEHQPPGHSLLTDIYDATLREPVRDVRELIAHPEDIPNAIASVASGPGPLAELPVVIAERATPIRAPIGGAVARTAAGASAEAVAADSTAVDQTISLSRARFGQAAEHAADAQAAGQPSTLTIDRAGAAANRAAATGRISAVLGLHLDEYPPAMFKEGGANASVRAINPADNMSAGAYIGNCCRNLPNGSQVRIEITE